MIEEKMMMMMEEISAIQRKHATITRPGQTRWEEMEMSMSMSMMKLISMKMEIKIKENNNHNHPKYQSHLPNPGELHHLPLSPPPFPSPSASLSTGLITPAVQQPPVSTVAQEKVLLWVQSENRQ